MDKPEDMISTYVTIRGKGDYPFAEVSWVIHRRDLADLDEPYLTAVKETRALKESRKVPVA